MHIHTRVPHDECDTHTQDDLREQSPYVSWFHMMLESDSYYGRHSRAKKSAGFTCTHIGNHALNGTDIKTPCHIVWSAI